MSRRIEVELTSSRDDGTWTWRAAGARQPKGVLDGGLLYENAKVGDVVRADAEFDIDGITVLAVLPPKGQRKEPERLEVVGPEREFTPVTSTLAKRERGERPRREGGDRDRDRDRRPGGGGGPRPDRARRDGREGTGPAREGTGPAREGAGRESRNERPRRERPAPPPPRPKAKKLRPRRVHRDGLMASLPPAQHPIAEQLMKGGMPAVRSALTEQNAKAKVEGKPEVPVTAVLAIAEDLAPAVRLAEWLDRAEAAIGDAEELSLQDLRAVVVSANDVVRDERASEVADQLRAVLDRRGPAELELWVSDVNQSLAAGRVVRALRLAARSPQPNEALPEELTTRLTESAGAAMTADIEPDRWGTVLDAVAYSPIRRAVVPAGAPAEPGDELLALVRKHAGRSPAIAALFGIEAPAPKEAGRRSRRGGGGGRPKAPGAPSTPQTAAPARPVIGPDGRRIPPPPPARPSAPADAPAGAQDPEAASPGSDATDTPAVAPASSTPPDAPTIDGSEASAPDLNAEVEPTPATADAGPAPAPEADMPTPIPDPAAPPVDPTAGTTVEPGSDDPRPHGDELLAPDGPPPSSSEGEPAPAAEPGDGPATLVPAPEPAAPTSGATGAPEPVAQPAGDDPRPHGDQVLASEPDTPTSADPA